MTYHSAKRSSHNPSVQSTRPVTDDPAGKRNLVAVVVTHNRIEKLKVTLRRLLSEPAADLASVLVFDNASSDGTGIWLARQADPRLHVVTSARNLGGAGGFEKALAEAVARFDPDWLVLMDDDARPAPGTLGAFCRDRNRDRAEAWAAAVTYPDGRVCDMNRPWINPFRSARDFWRGLLHGRDGFHLTEDDYAAPDQRAIDGCSFVGLFLSRDAIARVGYPDGRLFLYGDDVLYTLALSQAGGAIRFDPGLVFEHDCATLSDGASPVMSPLWKVYFFHRNQVFIYARAAGPVLFWPVFVVKAASWWVRARHYGPSKAAYRRLVRLALLDGLLRRTDRPAESVMVAARAAE